MYSYFKGEVVDIQSTYIVFEVNGIGYEVLVGNPFSYNDTFKKIFIYQHVREDELTLFGFKSFEEKQMFLDLISVKGIGPKTALAIIAVGEIDYIKNAIVNEDTAYLQRFPKIGKKAAQQILIDLSSKYEKESVGGIFATKVVNNEEEVLEALVALGYSKVEIKKHFKKVESSLSTEEKIKEILISMTK